MKKQKKNLFTIMHQFGDQTNEIEEFIKQKDKNLSINNLKKYEADLYYYWESNIVLPKSKISRKFNEDYQIAPEIFNLLKDYVIEIIVI